MPPQLEISAPLSGPFSALDLTLSNPSIIIDYNWRVYKDPCGSDHYPIIIEHSTLKKTQNHKQNPHNRISKELTGNPTKKSMPYHTNPRIKYKSRRTHNTFYQHPHYHSQ